MHIRGSMVHPSHSNKATGTQQVTVKDALATTRAPFGKILPPFGKMRTTFGKIAFAFFQKAALSGEKGVRGAGKA